MSNIVKTDRGNIDSVKGKKSDHTPKIPGKLEDSLKSLRGYLKELSLENQKLARELILKKEQREKRLRLRKKEKNIAFKRLQAMDMHINTTGEATQKQRTFLSNIQSFYHQNETALKGLFSKFQKIENDMAGGKISTASLKMQLKSMLQEIAKMRMKRNKVLGTM